MPTEAYVRTLLARPELALVPESCAAEIALHEGLVAAPLAPVQPAQLAAVLPADALITDPAETRAYECDALSAYACAPMIAVLPRTTAEVGDAIARALQA